MADEGTDATEMVAYRLNSDEQQVNVLLEQMAAKVVQADAEYVDTPENLLVLPSGSSAAQYYDQKAKNALKLTAIAKACETAHLLKGSANLPNMEATNPTVDMRKNLDTLKLEVQETSKRVDKEVLKLKQLDQQLSVANEQEQLRDVDEAAVMAKENLHLFRVIKTLASASRALPENIQKEIDELGALLHDNE